MSNSVLTLKTISSSRSSTSNTSIYWCCLLRHYSFFASGDPVPLPTVLEEESLAEATILSVDPAPEQLTYRIIDDGTIHRKKKLIDSRGFAYKVKEHGKETTCWQCTVRPKGNYCKATVKERNGQFVTGKQFHNQWINTNTFPSSSWSQMRVKCEYSNNADEENVDLVRCTYH